MGQKFSRAAGRVRTTTLETTSSSSSSNPSRLQNSVDRRPPVVPPDVRVHDKASGDAGEASAKSSSQVSEERDPGFEAMLSQMAGRITAKPGGQLEMGEAFVVQKSKRPLPKVRNTTPNSGRYEERPVAAGTLNVAQLRHIMLLHQGKADGHDGSINLKEISQRFRVDDAQLQKIFQFVSLPPEDAKKKRNEV